MSQGAGTPQHDEVDAALDALLSVKTWSEVMQIAEAQKALLLLDIAIDRLRERLTHSQTTSDASNWNTQRLEVFLRFLEEAHRFGFAEAHRAHLRRQIESSPWF